MQNKRRSIRLKYYNYSDPGDYFITICSQNRKCIFGEIVNYKMVLNEMGKIVEEEILKTTQMRGNIKIGIFRVMPNHVHLILSILYKNNGRGVLQYAPTGFVSPKDNIGSIVRGLKSSIAKRINIWRNTSSQPVFQRGYYEHIIRTPEGYQKIYNYILSNPQAWPRDRNNPDNFDN